MANNFTDRNKHSEHSKGNGVGFNLIPMSRENGYGRPQLDMPMSRPGPAYVNGPNQAPINLSGKENFTAPRFSGNGGTPSPSGPEDGKDSIETMGNDQETKAY